MKAPVIRPGKLWHVEALAPDLFRLRGTRERRFHTRSSGALAEREWPSPPLHGVGGRGGGTLDTSEGTFTLGRGGAWTLKDAHGITVFSSPRGGTGFQGGKAVVELELAEHESFFGLGETAGPLDRRGQVREFWNIDVLGHAPAIHPDLKSLYVSIPFAISLRDGRAAGLFWDNPARQCWNLGQARPDRWTLSADSGEIDLYLFLGPTVSAVVARYSQLTGTTPMPPRWALGYHQCRYSYESAERVEQVAGEFRRRKLPCDVLYLDIHHMDAYRVFTFGRTFPKPADLIRRLARRGFKVVTIVDPGVKDDPGFGVLRRGVEADMFVKEADGRTDFVGEVWPGRSRFPDFLNPGTRDWWGEEQKALLDVGVAGVWNDMNEPANFARPDKTLPSDALHRTVDGPRPHAEVHNLYGQEMARASREGALRHAPDRRPFVITRAGYAGIQRHALVWTGDNSSTWEHLDEAVRMLLNLSVSGVPFCGADVGGFLGNATPELYARWMQFAAFTPFFRGHTDIGTRDHEPWAFGSEVEEISRSCLTIRYRLLPLLYALFAEAHRTGSPVMRPLFWRYQNDPVAVACADQFLLGDDLLVAPVLRAGAVARSVYLPNDIWYDFWTGERFEGGDHVLADAPLDRIPLFVRAGALVPMGRERQSIGPRDDEGEVQLHVWPGHSGSLEWYEDDGTTMQHQSGRFHRRSVTNTGRGRRQTLRFGKSAGLFESRVRSWRLVVWNATQKSKVKVDGEALELDVSEEGLLKADIPNRPDAFTVEITGL
jgi:alpha-glucosidase